MTHYAVPLRLPRFFGHVLSLGGSHAMSLPPRSTVYQYFLPLCKIQPSGWLPDRDFLCVQ